MGSCLARSGLKTFEGENIGSGMFTKEELKAAKKEVLADVKEDKESVVFADKSPMPPVELAKRRITTQKRHGDVWQGSRSSFNALVELSEVSY